MKQTQKCASRNAMHEFGLLPLRMHDVFGCESKAYDLTPDKSSSAAASECITEPTTGAKSVFIWVQLMSLQLLTKVLPSICQMCGCSFLYLHIQVCVFDCDRLCVNVCVYEVKGESISSRWPQPGIGLTTALGCLWK